MGTIDASILFNVSILARWLSGTVDPGEISPDLVMGSGPGDPGPDLRPGSFQIVAILNKGVEIAFVLFTWLGKQKTFLLRIWNSNIFEEFFRDASVTPVPDPATRSV